MGGAGEREPGGAAALARSYLDKHGWTELSPGQAQSLWAPPGPEAGVLARVHVIEGMIAGSASWSWLVRGIAEREGRSPALVAAEILDLGQDLPPLQNVGGFQWVRLTGTRLEVLADRPVRLCVRRAGPKPRRSG